MKLFLSFYTSFQLFQLLQGHVGHHGGCRHQGQGVHQAVDEIIYFMLYIISVLFLTGN